MKNNDMPAATAGGVLSDALDTEMQWNKLFLSRKVFFALPVASVAAAPIAQFAAACGMRENVFVAHVGKAAAVALLGEKWS